MRILQLIQTRQNRGAETFACQLSNHLLKQGHDVKVISIYGGNAELGYSGEIISLGASFSKRFYDVWAWKRLSRIVKAFNPDVVQANAGDTLKYAVFSKNIFGWDPPIVVRNASEVGRYIHSYPQKILNSFLFKRIDKVISVSVASEKGLLQLFPFLRGKTSVVPVGLEKLDSLKDISFQPEGHSHIVHVGGFSFEKNHYGILKILKIILSEDKHVHLHLIGDGSLKKEIQETAKQMDLQDKISFYGFINNPLPYIKAADVLILPSIIEGLPGVLLEAMYCKTPVVAYNVGGIAEIVNPGTGKIITVDQEKEFAQATLEVLRHRPEEKIDNAYNMVRKSFMNEHISKKFLFVYSSLMR